MRYYEWTTFSKPRRVHNDGETFRLFNLLLRTTVGVSFPNWGFSVVVGCGVATKRRGVDFVVKKGVGGFAEGGRKGEERVRR